MKIDTESHDCIKALGNILKENQYIQKTIEKRLQYKFGSWYTGFAPTFLFPLFKEMLSERKNNLDILLLFFYCQQSILKSDLLSIINVDIFNTLINMKVIILSSNKNEVKSVIQILPLNELMIATDPPCCAEDGVMIMDFGRSAVMTLFPDSYDLAKYIFEKEINAVRALDMFCGNGVQSLVLSKKAEKVIGIDINEKALQYAKFNSVLNGISNVEFILHDVEKSMSDFGQFDVIVANPPFLPNANSQKKILFNDGGDTGDTFLKTLLKYRLPEVVKDGGNAFIIFSLALKEKQTPSSKIKSLYPSCIKSESRIIDLIDPNFEPILHSLSQFSVYYVALKTLGKLSGYAQELALYWKSLRNLGISRMTYQILELEKISFYTKHERKSKRTF